jgi:MurNAc alpha-1-phosphate uridylyltransferase
MLFAAGLGTRMAPLTADRPKPMIPVAGRPLIDHALGLLDGVDTGPVVINLHYLPRQIQDHLQGRHGIRFSHEPRLLETGGGLRKALPLLNGNPVITLNTDAVWTGPGPVGQLLRHWDPGRMEALLLTVPKDRAVGHGGKGDFIADSDGRLRRGAGDVYTGLQIIRTDRLAGIADPVFSLGRIWDDMAASGTLFGIEHKGGWCDVGRPESIALAEMMLGKADV